MMSWQYTNAQCYIDRHSTNWFDGWVSCETSPNPNSAYGNSHWILYDLGYVYSLSDMKIWNVNDPEHLDYGIEDYSIDYSLDGISWTSLGDFTLSQASGYSIYEGVEGPDFESVSAHYVLITPTSNFGGDCYGLSEVKFNIDYNTIVIENELGYSAIAFPNPFNESLTIRLLTSFTDQPINYIVYDISGRIIMQETISEVLEVNTIHISNNNLQSGVYFIRIKHNNTFKTIKVVKE